VVQFKGTFQLDQIKKFLETKTRRGSTCIPAKAGPEQFFSIKLFLKNIFAGTLNAVEY